MQAPGGAEAERRAEERNAPPPRLAEAAEADGVTGPCGAVAEALDDLLAELHVQSAEGANLGFHMSAVHPVHKSTVHSSQAPGISRQHAA